MTQNTRIILSRRLYFETRRVVSSFRRFEPPEILDNILGRREIITLPKVTPVSVISDGGSSQLIEENDNAPLHRSFE